MKVLQVNCVYNKGSTGKIVYDIHQQLLAQGDESVVCYGRGAKTTDSNVYKTCGELYSKVNNLLTRFSGLIYGGCRLSTNKLISVIKREKPDVVHVHCINGYFVNIALFMDWLKHSGIPTVLTLHAEFMHTANCSHAYDCERWKEGCGKCPVFRTELQSLFVDNTALSWKRMKKAFENYQNITVVSVSPWLRDRAKQSPILGGLNHKVILNGVNTDVFKRRKTNIYKDKHGITDEEIVFHAAPVFDNDPQNVKGGCHIIKLAQSMLGEKVKFFVAGDCRGDFEVPANIVLLGKVTDQNELAEYYSGADVTVIASKRETFSLVVAESLCCGTPVAGFFAGAPEQITIPEYSRFSEYGDVKKLKENVLSLLDCDFDKQEISKAATHKYEKEKMISEYINLYSQMRKEASK